MLRWIGYLLAMGVTLYVAAIYSSAEFVMLFVAELVWGIASLIYLIYQRSRLTVHPEFPLPAAELGQEVPIDVIIGNRGIFPVNKATVYLKYRSSGNRRKEKLKLTLFSGTKGEIRFSNRIKGTSSGSYHFEKATVVLYEPLKLLYIRKNISLHERLDVMPPIYNTGVAISERIRHFQGESDTYDTQHSGDDMSEMFRIREFRAGDKLKDVHWKLSAKEDEWLVREGSAPLACGVVLLLDFSAERNQWKNLDAILSLGASISMALMEQGCPHYVAWYRESMQEIMRVRVDGEESLSLFLMNLLEETVSGKKQNLPELYREQYKGEAFLTDICINMELQILVNGKVVTTCEAARLEENLEELLLQV